ncbi:MAG TPA: ATP-binding cassette domain-containing protein [Acidobacteriaceae bacterium]
MADTPTKQAITTHHRLTVHRQLGPLALDADLSVRAPWTLIYGPSGSGKTSLLHAACGFLGHKGITFTRALPGQAPQELISTRRALPPHELGLSYAPQQPTIFPHLRVLENITFGATSRGLTTSSSSTITELLDVFELDGFLTRRPHELSGGERQRVSLARAFAVPDVKLMLLDEPFSGVDRPTRDRLLPRMLHFLSNRNIPVLSVSHDVDEAMLLSAEVVQLRAGRIIKQGPAAEVLAEDRKRMLHALGV